MQNNFKILIVMTLQMTHSIGQTMMSLCNKNCISFTWQSSPLVRTSPFMYCLSSDGEIPKLLPIQRASTLPSGWLISTAPFRITYQRSSCEQLHQKSKITFGLLVDALYLCVIHLL